MKFSFLYLIFVSLLQNITLVSMESFDQEKQEKEFYLNDFFTVTEKYELFLKYEPNLKLFKGADIWEAINRIHIEEYNRVYNLMLKEVTLHNRKVENFSYKFYQLVYEYLKFYYQPLLAETYARKNIPVLQRARDCNLYDLITIPEPMAKTEGDLEKYKKTPRKPSNIFSVKEQKKAAKLIMSGLSEEIKNEFLFYAINKDSKPELIELLIFFDTDINSQDKQGNTALHLAAYSKNPIIVQSLIDHFANPNIKNLKKQKPIDVSRAPGITKYLKRSSSI